MLESVIFLEGKVSIPFVQTAMGLSHKLDITPCEQPYYKSLHH